MSQQITAHHVPENCPENCKVNDCRFNHAKRPSCRNGLACDRPGCWYNHVDPTKEIIKKQVSILYSTHSTKSLVNYIQFLFMRWRRQSWTVNMESLARSLIHARIIIQAGHYVNLEITVVGEIVSSIIPSWNVSFAIVKGKMTAKIRVRFDIPVVLINQGLLVIRMEMALLLLRMNLELYKVVRFREWCHRWRWMAIKATSRPSCLLTKKEWDSLAGLIITNTRQTINHALYITGESETVNYQEHEWRFVLGADLYSLSHFTLFFVNFSCSINYFPFYPDVSLSYLEFVLIIKKSMPFIFIALIIAYWMQNKVLMKQKRAES